MARPDPAETSHLRAALARVARREPLGRKLLVTPTMGGGRELLRRLALDTGGWIGFEVTTPRPLAMRLARAPMTARGLTALDPFEERACLDEALDRALIGSTGPWKDASSPRWGTMSCRSSEWCGSKARPGCAWSSASASRTSRFRSR